MRVRRVRAEEHVVVGEITLAAYAPFHVGDTGYDDRLRDVTTRDREAEVWVAVDDADRPLGSVTVCPPDSPWREVARDGEGEFRMLAVSPAAQGRGVGERLTRAVVDRFRKEGTSAVVLCSLPTMVGAHRLYDRLGFVRDPERDWSPAPGVDLISFAKDLTDTHSPDRIAR